MDIRFIMIAAILGIVVGLIIKLIKLNFLNNKK